MLPYKVTGKYELLIAALSEAGTSADCGEVVPAKPILSCFRENEQNPDEVLFDCILFLKSWRWKGVSKKERINILIHARERIRRENYALLSSSVCVNYFTGADDQPELLQAFHYDYATDQADHPLFHMQVTNRCIALSEADIVQLEMQMPAVVPPAVLRCARVPTCDMTLASVLLCLTADHVGGGLFAEFLTKICELQKEMPQPNIDKLGQSLGAPIQDVRSWHWFAHMVLPRDGDMNQGQLNI
jgi:hypothetical protein